MSTALKSAVFASGVPFFNKLADGLAFALALSVLAVLLGSLVGFWIWGRPTPAPDIWSEEVLLQLMVVSCIRACSALCLMAPSLTFLRRTAPG